MKITKNTKILITGAAGFIGSNLTRELQQTIRPKITVLDKASHDHKGVKLVKEDLSQFLKNKSSLKEFDLIYHFAGSASVKQSLDDPIADFENNLANTVLILENLRQLKKKPILVYPSSAAVYLKNIKTPINERSLTNPVSPYGFNKLIAESYIQFYALNFGIKALILRLFSVYGPGQKKQVIYDLVKRLKDNPKKLTVYGHPKTSRDFIYINDLARAIILVTQKTKKINQVYNLASGKSVSLENLVKNLCKVLHLEPRVNYLYDKELDCQKVNVKKIRALGFFPQVKFLEGLEETAKNV